MHATGGNKCQPAFGDAAAKRCPGRVAEFDDIRFAGPVFNQRRIFGKQLCQKPVFYLFDTDFFLSYPSLESI